MIKLIILIGLPGSGKSSAVQKLVAQCSQIQVISTDAIRGKLFGNEAIQGSWLMIWREVERQFRQAVAQISEGQIKVAIYDATNAGRKQRKEAIALARECGFNIISGLWIDTPLDICLSRNQQRDRQVPEEVILHMYRQLQDAPPALSDGFNHLIRRNS